MKRRSLSLSLTALLIAMTASGVLCRAQENDVTPLKTTGMNEMFPRNSPSSGTANGTQAAAPVQAAVISQQSSVDPKKEAQAFYQQANARIKARDFNGALATASQAIRLDPGIAGAYLARATAYYHLGEFQKAIEDTDKSISLDQYNPATYSIRSLALIQNGQLAEAEASVSKAITLDPNDASPYYGRALILEKAGKYKQMLEDLRKAAALDPDYKKDLNAFVVKYSAQTTEQQAQPQQAQPRPEEPQTEEQPRKHSRAGFITWTLAGLAIVIFALIQMIQHFRKKKGVYPTEGMLAQYTLNKQIGEGGMGLVYEATDKTLKRKVAIKKLRTEIGLSDEAKEELLNEARTVAALHHPNIVEIYTVFEDKGDLFLVFEYVEGQNLETKVDIEGPMSLLEAKRVFEPICKALEYAHNHGIIHRDLKPSNIMLSDNGEIKVMDFGVARQLESKQNAKTVSGTPAYMAPEQNKGFIRKESDIFSLGVCLYEVLVGHVPWEIEGYDPGKNNIIPPSEILRSIPKEIDKLVEMSLEQDPARRIKTAAHFWSLLQSVPAEADERSTNPHI